jgi:hypothetical protein
VPEHRYQRDHGPQSQGLEGCLEGKYVVAGPLDEKLIPPCAEKDKTVLVGICAKHLEGRGTYVQGCPPNNIFIVRAIVGEGQKIERRYATEEGATISRERRNNRHRKLPS